MNQLPPMTLLDYKVSSKELNMLKVMLPFVDINFQPMLAMYIKYAELRATMDLFSRNPHVFGSSSKSHDFTDIISAMLPYLSDEERESMENMQNIINTMNMFETYKDAFSPEMMSSFGDLSNFGDLSSFGDLSGFGDLGSFGDLSSFGDSTDSNDLGGFGDSK